MLQFIVFYMSTTKALKIWARGWASGGKRGSWRRRKRFSFNLLLGIYMILHSMQSSQTFQLLTTFGRLTRASSCIKAASIWSWSCLQSGVEAIGSKVTEGSASHPSHGFCQELRLQDQEKADAACYVRLQKSIKSRGAMVYICLYTLISICVNF